MENAVILAVDDEEKNLMLIEAFLVPMGYTMVTAKDGYDALEKVETEKPDLILLDVMMPGMSGYEVCKKVKSDSNTVFLPIVMLTSLDNMEAKIEGLEAGADDYLNKPFKSIELMKRVENLLRTKKLRDEVDKKNHMISSMLHHYIDDSIIEQILANPEKHSELGGEKREVAVFFCDIRGFTSLSEKMKADDLIHLLNSIYRELTRIVFRNKGTFDKYIGDCIMAFWGAPSDVEDETLWAIRAALEMQSAFNDLRQTWPREQRDLGIGIGINYGDAIVGNIGTEDVMDYTVMGDVVNTAYRVESRAQRGQILITKSALSRVEGKIKIRALEPVQLKGKSRPVEIYEVLKGGSEEYC